MKRIIRLTESDLTRIVRRVIQEQDDMATLPASEIPNNIPSTISGNEIEELQQRQRELQQEFKKLQRITGGPMGRSIENLEQNFEKIKESVIDIKDNMVFKLEEMKSKLSLLREKAKQEKQAKRNQKQIESLERQVQRYEKSIEQIKNNKIISANDLKNFLDVALPLSPIIMSILAIITTISIGRSDDDPTRPGIQRN